MKLSRGEQACCKFPQFHVPVMKLTAKNRKVILLLPKTEFVFDTQFSVSICTRLYEILFCANSDQSRL